MRCRQISPSILHRRSLPSPLLLHPCNILSYSTLSPLVTLLRPVVSRFRGINILPLWLNLSMYPLPLSYLSPRLRLW